MGKTLSEAYPHSVQWVMTTITSGGVLQIIDPMYELAANGLILAGLSYSIVGLAVSIKRK
ncbi:hypothetical protein [Leptolyngbya sp. AN10]|uniref:hypothetical protein n=1 Tax=Leptolyngbya sp. AN10 TaxID=3423365 RepID=UPI003D31948F